jgi:hypothetical protein
MWSTEQRKRGSKKTLSWNPAAYSSHLRPKADIFFMSYVCLHRFLALAICIGHNCAGCRARLFQCLKLNFMVSLLDADGLAQAQRNGFIENSQLVCTLH